MSMKRLPKDALAESYKEMVRTACLSLADVCYKRIMSDPEEGLRHLSFLASHLDCSLKVDFRVEAAHPKEGEE